MRRVETIYPLVVPMNDIDKYEAKALELIEGKKWKIVIQDSEQFIWCDIAVPCSGCPMLEFFKDFEDDRGGGCYNFRLIAENWFQENKYPWLFL